MITFTYDELLQIMEKNNQIPSSLFTRTFVMSLKNLDLENARYPVVFKLFNDLQPYIPVTLGDKEKTFFSDTYYPKNGFTGKLRAVAQFYQDKTHPLDPAFWILLKHTYSQGGFKGQITDIIAQRIIAEHKCVEFTAFLEQKFQDTHFRTEFFDYAYQTWVKAIKKDKTLKEQNIPDFFLQVNQPLRDEKSALHYLSVLGQFHYEKAQPYIEKTVRLFPGKLKVLEKQHSIEKSQGIQKNIQALSLFNETKEHLLYHYQTQIDFQAIMQVLRPLKFSKTQTECLLQVFSQSLTERYGEEFSWLQKTQINQQTHVYVSINATHEETRNRFKEDLQRLFSVGLTQFLTPDRIEALQVLSAKNFAPTLLDDLAHIELHNNLQGELNTRNGTIKKHKI